MGADAFCIFVSRLVFNREHVCGNLLVTLGTEPEQCHGIFFSAHGEEEE